MVDFGQKGTTRMMANGFLDLLRIELNVVDDAQVGTEGTKNSIVSEVHNAIFVVFLQGRHELLEVRLGCLEEVGIILCTRNGQKDVRAELWFGNLRREVQWSSPSEG